MATDWINRVIVRISELDDRASPDGWPEAMVVTADELLGRLVVATRAGDGAKVFDLIHEFTASRCVVREAGSPTH